MFAKTILYLEEEDPFYNIHFPVFSTLMIFRRQNTSFDLESLGNIIKSCLLRQYLGKVENTDIFPNLEKDKKVHITKRLLYSDKK